MSRIDKQELSGVSDVELFAVAKFDSFKKKSSLISIESKILSLLSVYKSLQYKSRESLPCVSDIYKRSIDYFRLFIIAKYSSIIVTNINLNVYQQTIIKLPKKRSYSYL